MHYAGIFFSARGVPQGLISKPRSIKHHDVFADDRRRTTNN